MKSAEAQVMANVAEILGNTPAVARGSYVDPRVIVAFEGGATISAALRRAGKAKSDADQQAIVDKAVIRLIRRQAKA
jgi:DNA topoisomerase IB